MRSDRLRPFDDIETWMDDLRSRFEALSGPGGLPGMGTREVAIDLADLEDELVVTADLPGYEKADIEVKLVDGHLYIEAEREAETEAAEDGIFLTRERRRRRATRSVPLPVPVDESAIEATYRNGVLTVTLPKLHKVNDSTPIDIE